LAPALHAAVVSFRATFSTLDVLAASTGGATNEYSGGNAST
jgi:hypothetical protein